MFVGHLAVGLAAKRAAPGTSLGTLLLAATWSDVLFSVLLLAGVERAAVGAASRYMPVELLHLPWSHSLLMTALWAGVLAASYRAATGYGRGALLVAACVLSHWFLDAASHRPDMLVSPGGGLRVGAGLWDHPLATFLVEGGLFAGALVVYARTTRAVDPAGRWAFAAFAAALTLLYLGTFFAPPPPDVRAMAWGNLSGGLFLLWAAWFDSRRVAA